VSALSIQLTQWEPLRVAAAAAGPWAGIGAIRSYLPERVVTNEELSEAIGWTPDEILAKTGIAARRVAAPDECVSDLATAAAERLLADLDLDRDSVEFLILCTQTPDHFLPTTACLVQERLGLCTDCAAFDVNQGCSGYLYSLGIASGFIRSRMFSRGMVITADTYSKLLHPQDRSVRTLFGDAAAATWIMAGDVPGLEHFVFGTDGRGAQNLIVPAGGARLPRSAATGRAATDSSGNRRSQDNLFMNGPEIFAFVQRRVPELVESTLGAAGLGPEEIDAYVFHQANRFMLEHLRHKMRIPRERMILHLEEVGNTVSSTIPLALEHAAVQDRFAPGDRLLLAGFGVGYSWGAAILTWGDRPGDGRGNY
jgi:3-oxoacyl-[acyl-carrier-protein] synthase-3